MATRGEGKGRLVGKDGEVDVEKVHVYIVLARGFSLVSCLKVGNLTINPSTSKFVIVYMMRRGRK